MLECCLTLLKVLQYCKQNKTYQELNFSRVISEMN